MKHTRDVIKKITPDEALQILNTLAREDIQIAKRIKQLSMRSLKEVDIDSVADDVCSELDCLEVEDLWDRSGETAHGYVDPGEEAWVMFEEALEPFEKNLKRYQELKMHSEAKNYCKGILLGIYQFENEADSKFVKVEDMGDEDDCLNEMFVKIKLQGRKLSVPLSQLGAWVIT